MGMSLHDLVQPTFPLDRVEPATFANIVFAPNDRLAVLAMGTSVPQGTSLEEGAVKNYMRSTTAILASALKINPDESRVLRWFNHERLSDFNLSTPAEIVAQGRSDALLLYIQSLDAGSTG